jgi:hypothetical protein
MGKVGNFRSDWDESHPVNPPITMTNDDGEMEFSARQLMSIFQHIYLQIIYSIIRQLERAFAAGQFDRP